MKATESVFDARPPGCDCQWFENQVCDACQGIDPNPTPDDDARALGVDPADPAPTITVMASRAIERPILFCPYCGSDDLDVHDRRDWYGRRHRACNACNTLVCWAWPC